MLSPALGWFFYTLFKTPKIKNLQRKKSLEFNNKITNKIKNYYILNMSYIFELKKENIFAVSQANYLINYANANLYKDSSFEYYPLGEIFFEALLKYLKKAKKFIFMEYFIIKESFMWDSILEILKFKAKQGIEVRLMFDDLGCINTLPKNYKYTLESYGIKCTIFNPVKPIFASIYNNRTHRKITIIDGEIAFTGGINLSDEYINKTSPFGHWKDTGISITGESVWSFTIMFLSSWSLINKKDEDFLKYKASYRIPNSEKNSYVIPFFDNPLDHEIVSHNVYLNLIQSATKYIYINTPYLIVGHDILNSLCSAAKKGVEVIICTPHIPDKKAVFEVTRSKYEVLIKNGVKIYEYTPGFLHAKSFVVDDIYSVIGTINLDYRSLYLHFECGVWIYNSEVIFDIKKDYLKTLKLCKKITLEDCKKISKIKRLYREILNIFAPLL